MRLYEIDNTKTSIPSKIYKLIQRNCTTTLNACEETGRLLFRGSTKHEALYYAGDSPKDRHPRDTMKDMQEGIDAFLQHLGFKALRNNSTFVSSNLSIAKNYSVPKTSNIDSPMGNIYIVFPIDPFDFTWSERTTDLYGLTLNPSTFFVRQSNYQKDPSQMFSKENLFKFQDFFQFRNDKLTKAMKMGTEIMVHGSYYAIHIRFIHDVQRILFGGMQAKV